MARVSVLGAFVSVVWLAPLDAVDAGDTTARPPVRVVAPTSASGVRLERDDLPVPAPEVQKHPAKVDTPAVPAFDLPATEPGFRAVRELRVRGKRVLGGEVKLKGYVTWIYDCAQSLASANPDATRQQIAAAIRSDATLCERPMFSLGDARDTSRDASILVVELKGAPRVAVGDHVIVRGVWSIPAQYADSDGVLVFGALEPAAAPGPAADPAVALKELEIDLDGEAAPPMRRFVDDVTLNTSIGHLNACNKAFAAKQHEAAIAACQAATEVWQDNHLAWYTWASVHMARREWAQARAMVENAVTLRPDQPMYQLYYGISLYEAERQQAREDLARKEAKRPEEVEIDPAALKLDAARAALTSAIKATPELWRAHYYLGRVYRDLDDARRAAQQFTATIKTHPGYRNGYIALGELYRRWDYLDQALAVATLGTANVAPAEASELWVEVAMVHQARHADDKAIEALGKALAGRPEDAFSKLQRGQIYFHKGELANARRDLEDVTRSSDRRVASAKPLAAQLLAKIASSRSAPPSRDRSWDCRRSGSAIICRPLFTQGSTWFKGYRTPQPE